MSHVTSGMDLMTARQTHMGHTCTVL